MSIDDWSKKLDEQSSLLSVFLESEKSIPKSKGNRTTVFLVFLLSTILVIVGSIFGDYGISESYDLIHQVSNLGFQFSIGILGFLVAGFSVFASITRPQLFILLAKIKYDETNITRFQYIFFIFLNVFTIYLILLSTSLSVSIFFSNSSPLYYLGAILSEKYPRTCMCINGIGLVLIISLLTEAIVRLKSFIWNLYQAIIVVIATEEILDEAREGND